VPVAAAIIAATIGRPVKGAAGCSPLFGRE
jgi:hypothetical protein